MDVEKRIEKTLNEMFKESPLERYKRQSSRIMGNESNEQRFKFSLCDLYNRVMNFIIGVKR